jgi:hypothetical protein
MTAIHYRTAKVDGKNVFYREAGAPGAPILVLNLSLRRVGCGGMRATTKFKTNRAK